MSAPLLSPLGEIATSYAQRGWPVLPLHTPTSRGCSCHQPTCQSIGKHPRTRRGLRDATTDLDRVTGWWQRWPHANSGIATGRTSGLVVIDIDPDHGGETSLRRLQHAHPLPRTAQAGSGTGRHLYYTSAEAVPSSIGRLGEGIDVRANGGYIVAPGSRHASGRRYRWIISTAIAPLPEPLAARLTELTQARTAPDRARSITDATT